MTSSLSSFNFESYVPVYDVIPQQWDDARGFLTEMLKRYGNGINQREIGFFIDDEVLAGKFFIPTAAMSQGNQSTNSQQFRSVFRYVVDVHPLVAGINTFPLPITFDANFILFDLWVAATNSTTKVAQVITDKNVILNGAPTNTIVITSPGAFDRAFCIIEYIQEV